jgi:hypothetical protein
MLRHVDVVTEARAIAKRKAAEMAALSWEELDAYGKREEIVTSPSGATLRVKSLAYWDMEEWNSGLDIVVKVYPGKGFRRFWPYKAYASRGDHNDPVPQRPSR